MELLTGNPGLLDRKSDFDEDLPQPGDEPTTQRELLAYYRSLYQRAQSIRDEQVKVQDWDEHLRAYRNHFTGTGTSINQVYSNGKVIVLSASYRNPRVIVTPFNDPRLWFHAKVRERLDNWTLDRLEVGALTKELNLDVFLYGRTFVKLGFSSEYAQTTGSARSTSEFDYSDVVRGGEPWVKRVDPRNVWIIGGPNWQDVRFVFHRFYRPLEDVLADPRYEHVDGIGPEAGADRWEDVELFEVWDKKRRTSAVFSDHANKFVRKPKRFLWWPWDSLDWNADGVNFWPASDVAQFWPQQIEMNRTREQLRRHGLIALVKFIVSRGVFSEDELDKFLSNIIGVVVEAKSSNLDQVIKMFATQIPQELFQLLSECRQDIKAILGHNENVMGAYTPKSRVTAAETREVGAGTDLRLSDRKLVTERFVQRVCKTLHVVTLLGWKDQSYGNTMIVKGPDDVRRVVTWSMEDLRDIIGAVEVEVEDRPTRTSFSEKSEMGELVAFLRSDPNVSPDAIAKIVQEYFGGNKPVPAPQPMINPTQAPNAASPAPMTNNPGGVNTSGGGMA